jgi:hypothetical protein
MEANPLSAHFEMVSTYSHLPHGFSLSVSPLLAFLHLIQWQVLLRRCLQHHRAIKCPPSGFGKLNVRLLL